MTAMDARAAPGNGDGVQRAAAAGAVGCEDALHRAHERPWRGREPTALRGPRPQHG